MRLSLNRYNEDKTEVKMIESLSGRLGIPLEVRFVFPLVAALNQILLAVRHCQDYEDVCQGSEAKWRVQAGWHRNRS